MEIDEIISNQISEIRRGTLVLVILGNLMEPKYGYSLIQSLADSGIPVEANTLYPLLRRLEAQGLLEACWSESASKPRKYYKISENGKTVFKELKEYWESTTASMNKILEGYEK